MKTGQKPLIIKTIILILLTAAFVLSYVAIKLQYEVSTKIKAEKEETLRLKKDSTTYLIADKQKYSTGDRITSVAVSQLELVKDSLLNEKVIVERNRIERIDSLIKLKYE